MTDQFDKARHFPRVKAEHLISVRPREGEGQGAEVTTTTKVLGLGGLMFEHSQELAAGQRLEIDILTGTELLKLDVRVVWCRPIPHGGWGVGVEFLDPDQETQTKILDSLLRWVYLEEQLET